MKWITLFIFAGSTLFSEIGYYSLINQFSETLGRNGSWKNGEIEIATSPNEIKKIENTCSQRLVRMGYSKKEAEKFSRVGIVSEDNYWIWVRDAVIFPGGIPGTYDRMVLKSHLTGPPGVVIFPLLSNKKVIVNIHFRHATRSWEMELPRGFRNQGEDPKDTAARELREETGYIANDFELLGQVVPDSGISASIIPVYFGHIREKKERHLDQSEVIDSNLQLSIDEIREAYLKGYIVIEIKGVKTKVYCRDGFLTYAILQALWKKLI